MSRMLYSFVPALFGAALTLSPAPLAAQTVVKIGLINSYTGVVGQAAGEAQKAIDLYLKLHQKDLPADIKLDITKRDDTSNPEAGKRLAQEVFAPYSLQ